MIKIYDRQNRMKSEKENWNSLFAENFHSVSSTILRSAEIMITQHEFASYGFREQEANVKPAKLISKETVVLHR